MHKPLSILLFLLVASIYARAQDLNNQKPVYISVKDGLPDATITAICQDGDGFLWIGTNYGLSRYDGVEFVNYYHSKAGPSIPGNYINALKALPGHRLLVASASGLCLFNTRANTFKNLNIHSDAVMFTFENNFRTIATDKYGHIWAGSQTCLYELDSTLNILQRKNGYGDKRADPNLFLFVDVIKSLPDGRVIFKTQQAGAGLPYRWYISEGSGIVPLEESNVLYKQFLDPVALRDVVFDSRGDAWYVKNGVDSLFYFDWRLGKVIASRLDKVTDSTQLTFNSQVSMINDKFFGCSLLDGGLLYTNILEPASIKKASHWDIILAGKHVTSVFYDRENNIWIGTTNGLYKYTMALNNLAVSAMPEKDMLTGHNIELSNIFTTPGRLFLSTTGGGIFYTSNKDISWQELTWPSKPELNDTWSVRATGKGNYWIATQSGLYEWGGTGHQTKQLFLPPQWQWINTLPITTQFLDKENILWLGLGGGKGVAAYNLTTQQIKLYSRQTTDNFPLRYPITIDEDEHGNLWMGGVEGRGLVYWDRKADRFTLFPPVFNSEFDSGLINAIYADRKGSLWLGTTGGLVNFNISTHTFKRYNVQQGLSSNAIYSIEADSSKHLWVGTKNGLSCMDLGTNQIINFNGFYQNSEDPVYSVKYAASVDKIYFTTPHNFYSITPSEWLRRREPPPLFISSVTSSGKSLAPEDRIRLDYNNNNINIAFTAINLVDGGQNKYFYRLNNQKKNWISAGSSRQISFSSLLPGDYIFEVKARLSNGTWSKNRAVVLFSVAAPFWKTWWFILLSIAIITSVIYLLYRYRIRQIMAVQNIRSRIASDLHDDIGSTLSNIHILTQLSHANLAEPEKANGFLTRIAQEVNTSSQSLDDIVWSINTRNDNFEEIAARMRRYAAELFESADIEYKVDFDEKLLHRKLNLEQRRDIYLIFKEALNNIYKHAQATSVTITLTTDHQYFKMTVEDNGKGFDTTAFTTRNGLKNMKARAKNHRGSFAAESKKGVGTTLSVTMRIFS